MTSGNSKSFLCVFQGQLQTNYPAAFASYLMAMAPMLVVYVGRPRCDFPVGTVTCRPGSAPPSARFAVVAVQRVLGAI